MWVAMGFFYQMIPKNLTILYAWVSRSHICEIDQNPDLTGIGICSVCYLQNWESWKGFEIIILMVWWHFMKKYVLLCVYSDIHVCHRHFMLHRVINYFIERFGYFLVCSVINAVIINAVKDQKVTKTLNNVIDSSMRHKMLVAYVRIYTQQSIFFHELSLDHQNYNFEAFSWLSMLLIADKTNTNSCQAWILVNFTNVATAHSSIQYRQIFSYHLIEETYTCSYPHVWKFPKNMLKYLYGGTFEKCKLFFDTHCIGPTYTSKVTVSLSQWIIPYSKHK